MPHPAPQKRLYDIPEAGVYLGRTPWGVRRLIWSGALPAVRVGRRVHVDVRDMDEFIEKAKVREEDSRLPDRGLDKPRNKMLSDAVT
jgi:excisionase family DNA binding protein